MTQRLHLKKAWTVRLVRGPSTHLADEECQLKANGIVQSTYARRYREPIERLVKMVKQMVKFYNKWLGVQKLWAYMVPIFSGSDLST